MARVAAGLALFVLPWADKAYAQEQATVPSTYAHVIHSQLNGVDYKLTVVVPPDYESSPTTRYPVLYVMDGNRWALLLGVMLPRLWPMGMLPKIIVVGIDYPGPSGRNQDYGPVTQRYFPVDPKRGAANFMRVVKQEILPFVDSSYRTDPADRGIGGHSMGGLFSAYALLHETETFQRFWISSPSLFWDDEILFKDFAAFHGKRLPKPIHVFTDVGADELPDMQSTLERFGQKLLERRSGEIILEMRTQPGENHTTVVTSVFIRALEHLYMYKPRYRDSSVEFHAGGLVRMTAYAPNKFFIRTPRVEMEFPEGSGNPPQVRYYDAMKDESVDAMRVR